MPAVPEKDYIRRGTQILAKKLDGGSIKHAHLDHLGTPRYWTNNSNGSAFARHDYLPFGEEVTTSVDMEEIEFTGHERDTHFVGNCSPDTADIDDQTLATGQVITACTTITSEDTTVTSTDEVRFTAGEEVILEAGFVVDAGASFLAEIDGNLQADSQDLDYMHARFCSPYLARFASPDPAMESASPYSPQTWNRYSYAAGSPLKYVDPTGEILYFFGVGNDPDEVEKVANNTLVGVDLVIDANGNASLVTNNETGKPTAEQQALQDLLSAAIGDPRNIGINVTSGDSDVIFGQFVTATIDIGDIAAVGSGEGVDAASIFAHEIAEQTAAQTQGLPFDAAGHAMAHRAGVAAQESVSGYTRLKPTVDLRRGTGSIVGHHQRGNATVTVTFRFVNGNLVRVQR